MKNIKTTLTVLLVILFVACIPAIASNNQGSPEKTNSGHRISETPNISVEDQFGNPVSNVTINVTHEQNGDTTSLEVITPGNGMVPLEALEGTYAYTVKSVPTGYTSTDQKVIQEYKPGASFNGKTIKISKTDNYNPSQFSSSLNNYFEGINISSDYNFTANFVFEFKTFLEGMIREQVKIVNEEEKKVAEQNPSLPQPTPAPPVQPPTPEPTPAPTPEPTSDFDLICAIVASESETSYEGALAVISCVMNRVDSGLGSSAIDVLTAPGQSWSYSDGTYVQYLGNTPSSVQQAVRDCMDGGIRSHSYTSFRNYETSGSVFIAGNWYF